MTSKKPDKIPEDAAIGRSTLFSFWPEAEAPIQEEIRLAIDAAFPGVDLVEELDAEDGMLWGGVYKLPEHESEVIIWVEDRDVLGELFVEDEVTDPEELKLALAARFVVGCETQLVPRQALADFQSQLRLIEAASVAGLVAVYDESALIVRSAARVKEIARAANPPRPSTLYAIHEAEGNGRIWLHTHGLPRLGIPEIELLGLGPSDVQEGYDLIDAIVDVVFGGGEPDEDGLLAIGEDMEVRLVTVPDALAILPPEVVALRAYEDDDEEHPDPRIAILSRDRSDPPYEAIERLKNDGVLFKSREETDRQKSLAIERFGVFGQLFVMRKGSGWRFHAKLGFPRDGDPRVREHLWFEVQELKPGRLRGTCLNEPVEGLAIHEGDDAWFPLEQLTDWVVVTPEGNFDPEAAPVLLEEE